MLRIISMLIVLLAVTVSPAFADGDRHSFGGDEFAFGESATLADPIVGDVFAFGANMTITGLVGGDVHAIAGTVRIDGDVSGNIYAFGNEVTVSGKTTNDITTTGGTINLNGPTAGNVRAFGADITLASPVAGSVAVAAGKLKLSSTIAGDFTFSGGDLTFGPDATVAGNVTVRISSDDFSVPASVAPPSRVTIEKIRANEFARDAGDIAKYSARGFWVNWIPRLIWLITMPVIGIIWLAIFPKRSVTAYNVAMGKPWKSLAFGIWGTAAFFGLIPLSLIALITIPLTPFAIIALIIATLIGYLAGAWFLASRVLASFNFDNETLVNRAIAMVVGVIAAGLLGLIPVLGWLVQLALMFVGIGGIIFAAMGRTIDKAFHKELASR